MIPNRAVASAHETTVIAKTDGTTLRGLGIREDAQAVSLSGPEGTVADVPKAQIKARTKEKISIMSEEMADTIPRDQLRNLAEFLTASPGSSGK